MAAKMYLPPHFTESRSFLAQNLGIDQSMLFSVTSP
jgi:hypothetical protein